MSEDQEDGCAHDWKYGEEQRCVGGDTARECYCAACGDRCVLVFNPTLDPDDPEEILNEIY